MDTTIEQSAITPKRGEIKPVDIFSLERRELDEKTVTGLVKALARDGRLIHQILVRDEGATGYRLITGYHRLEAWKRHFGKEAPIPADIFSSDTPDAQIAVFEIEENLLRKELTAAEREAHTIRLVAALQELNGEEPESGEAPESGKVIPTLTLTRRGRGNKGLAQRVAERVGITKRAVNMRAEAASAAIGEKIDLDRDTPEELKRKADKRQHAEPTLERPERRKPAPRGAIDILTRLAKPQAGKVGGQIKDVWDAFDAISRADQLRFIHDACLRLGLDPLKMGSPAAFGLPDDDRELAVDLEAEVERATEEAAAEPEPEQRDDAANLGTEDLQIADDDVFEDADDHAFGDADDDVFESADQEDLGAEDLQGDGGEVSKAGDQEPGGAPKCAYCNIEFESGDQLEEFNGQLYHGFCVEDGKRLAKAKQGKQIAVAA